MSGACAVWDRIHWRVLQGEIDALVFFWDPLQLQPHDTDVKALLRIATLWNIPVAGNRATAHMLITSPPFAGDHRRRVPPFIRPVADPTRGVP